MIRVSFPKISKLFPPGPWEESLIFFNAVGLKKSNYRTSKIKLYSIKALECYINEKNLINGRVTSKTSKFGA